MIKFKADTRRVGQPDFARWASTDFAALDREMASGRYVPSAISQMYEIPGPPDEAIHAETIPQFVCMDNWRLLRRNSALCDRKDKLKTKIDWDAHTDRHNFRVHQAQFWNVVNQKRDLVDRDITLMRVDREWRFELALPSTDKKRVHDFYRRAYKDITNHDIDTTPDHLTGTKPELTVRYSCVLHVMFAKVPLVGALRPRPSTP